MTVKELEAQASSGVEETAVQAKTQLVWRARFRLLNKRIKELTAEQVKDKAVMRLRGNGRGSPEEARRIVELASPLYGSQSVVLFRAIRITAALNLHHEMRGSNYQHFIHDPGLRAVMNVGFGMLREEIEKECAST